MSLHHSSQSYTKEAVMFLYFFSLLKASDRFSMVLGALFEWATQELPIKTWEIRALILINQKINNLTILPPLISLFLSYIWLLKQIGGQHFIQTVACITEVILLILEEFTDIEITKTIGLCISNHEKI